MKLEGIHHITAICADAKANVDFYTKVLGLRMVKKTVNYDMPDVYHLYYGDDVGSPGSVLTFFEFPGAQRGVAGTGMIYKIIWRVASASALDFWQSRLSTESVIFTRDELTLSFFDREGLGLELAVVGPLDPPLMAKDPNVLPEYAIRGFQGVRAYSRSPDQSDRVLAAMGMTRQGGGDGVGPPRYLLQGEKRRATYSLEPAPQTPA
ncbi:MAG: VOC family protein, partial [Acidimicrobiia bacterium]